MLEFRMKMAERFEKDERTMNALWTVNASARWTVNAELWKVSEWWTHGERSVSERWTHGERTMSESKNGKVERFRDCTIHVLYVYIQKKNFLCFCIQLLFFIPLSSFKN